MTHAAPEFAPKPCAALTRCEACGNTDTCVRPTARDMPAIKRRLGRGVEPDTRWLCPDCADHRKRAHALSAALRCALRPHPATVEAAVVDAALRGTAIDPDAVPPTVREGLLWTLTGRDLWRLDEAGQLADADDRPGPPRPALLRPAHPWTVAPVADRWGMTLAEYKIIAPEWQRWGRPAVAQIVRDHLRAPWVEVPLERLDGWWATGRRYTWPSEAAPLLECWPMGDGKFGGEINVQIPAIGQGGNFSAALWERFGDRQDQSALWRALALIGVAITPPCRRVAVTDG